MCEENKLKHVGVRPGVGNPLVDGRIGGRHYLVEKREDGSRVFWNKKSINSGCDKEFTKEERLEGLLYCPFCREYRREIEFEV